MIGVGLIALTKSTLRILTEAYHILDCGEVYAACMSYHDHLTYSINKCQFPYSIDVGEYECSH